MPAPVWGGVVLAFLTGHALSALKWRWLLAASGLAIGRLEALRAHAAGLFASLCLPTVVGGDLVRAGLVVRARGRLETVALASLADRLNDLFALMAVGAGAVVLVPDGRQSASTRLLLAFAIGLPIAVLAGVALLVWMPIERLPRRLQRSTRHVRAALESLSRRPGAALGALSLSFVVQGGFAGLNVALARALDAREPASLWLLGWPLAKLAALAPVSLGGLGVRELALAAVLAPFGVQPATATAQSLCWEAVLVISGVLAGSVALALGVRWPARPDPGAPS